MLKHALTHDQFADRCQEKASTGDRVLTDAFLELTRLCSLRCVHCYIGDARWKKDQGELDTEAWKRLISTLADRGVLWLFFTGGEPTIRPDFRELWKYAQSKGFLTVLYTNATLIDDSLGTFLSAHPPAKVEVSIYGSSASVYEKVTGVPGSYARFRRGVDQIRTRGFQWKLKVVEMQQLLPDLPAIRILANEWNVPLIADSVIMASIGGGDSGGKAPCAARAPEEDLVAHHLTDQVYVEEFTANAKGCVKASQSANANQLYRCGAGADTFYITSTGKMQMCSATPHHAIQLDVSGEFGAQLNSTWDAFGKLRELQRTPASPCFNCDLQILCSNCPGMANLEHGDEHGAIAWICRQTHLKAHLLKIPHKCDVKHLVYSQGKATC